MTAPPVIAKADAVAAPLEVIKAAPRSRDWYYYDPIDRPHGPFLIIELKQAYKKGMIGECSLVANTKLLQKTTLKDSFIYGYVKGEEDVESLKKSTGNEDLYDSHKKGTTLKDKIAVAVGAIKCRWCGEFLTAAPVIPKLDAVTAPPVIPNTKTVTTHSDDLIGLDPVLASRDWYYYEYFDNQSHGPFFISELKKEYEQGRLGKYDLIENTKLLPKTALVDCFIYPYVEGKQDVERLKESTSIADLCKGQSPNKEISADNSRQEGKDVQGSSGLRNLGIVILLGGIIALFLSLGMDTSAEVSSSGLFGLLNRVNNLGLMNGKQNHIIISCVVLLIGVIVSLFGVLLKKNR